MKYFALLFLLLILCGCAETVTQSHLNAKVSEHMDFTFPEQTYYVGSKGDYDYFIIRRGLGKTTHHYRVLKSESTVSDRFALTKDETRWLGYGVIDLTAK